VVHHNQTGLTWIALSLAIIGGFVDAVGYLALFRLFTAHMRGNTVAGGADLAQQEWSEAVPPQHPDRGVRGRRVRRCGGQAERRPPRPRHLIGAHANLVVMADQLAPRPPRASTVDSAARLRCRG